MPPLDNDDRKFLKDLEDSSGNLNAEVVVQAARKASSPLHRYFTWDNDIPFSAGDPNPINPSNPNQGNKVKGPTSLWGFHWVNSPGEMDLALR